MRFLNVSMQCPVDVIESLVEPLHFWSRYAVISLAGLSHRSARRWRPWACHATNHKNFIYHPIFIIFAAKNQQSTGYNHTKKRLIKCLIKLYGF